METILVQTPVGPAQASNILPLLNHGNVTAWQCRLTLHSGDGVVLTEDFQLPTTDRKPVAQWRTQELASLIRALATDARVHAFVKRFEEACAVRLDTTFTEAQLIDDGV